MPTFQINDPSSAVTLTQSGKDIAVLSKGAVIFAVANTSASRRTATVTILPENPEELSFYSFASGGPGQEGRISVDFAPRETQNLTVAITAAHAASPRKCSFRLRVAQETEPSIDVVESLPVAFELAPLPSAAKVRAQVPWKALAVAAALVILAAGGGLWLKLRPAQTKEVTVPNLVNHPFEDIGKIFSALNGEVSALVDPVTTKDPSACTTSIDSQSPLSPSNLYPAGTVFSFHLREGTGTALGVDVRRCFLRALDLNVLRAFSYVRIN